MWSKQKGENMTEIQENHQVEFNNFIERIERLEEEKKELLNDIREIFENAKGRGYDTKVMRQILKLRKMTPAYRSETEFLRDEYKKLAGITE